MHDALEFSDFALALPRTSAVVVALRDRLRSGEITTLDGAHEYIRLSITRSEVEELERFAPGWRELADYDDLTTLGHVIISLLSLPYHREYLDAGPSRQRIVTYALLYHDLAKRSAEGRDHTHAFRSAAMAARSLPLLRLDLARGARAALEEWAHDATNAVCRNDDGQLVQDNSRIPELFGRLDAILAADSAPNRMIKIVLLHHSVDVLKLWPQANPLTRPQIERWLDQELLVLLRILMLADCDGWELLNARTCNEYRREIRAMFDRYLMAPQ